MNLLTAYEIANNYPDQILIYAGENEGTGKFAVLMYRLKGTDIHKLMMSSEAVFETAEAAKEVAHNVCKSAIEWVKKESALAPSSGEKEK